MYNIALSEFLGSRICRLRFQSYIAPFVSFVHDPRPCKVASCAEFYEELLSLVYSLTSRQISTRMWQILPHLHQLFYDDNVDLFVGELCCPLISVYLVL